MSTTCKHCNTPLPDDDSALTDLRCCEACAYLIQKAYLVRVSKRAEEDARCDFRSNRTHDRTHGLAEIADSRTNT